MSRGLHRRNLHRCYVWPCTFQRDQENLAPIPTWVPLLCFVSVPLHIAAKENCGGFFFDTIKNFRHTNAEFKTADISKMCKSTNNGTPKYKMKCTKIPKCSKIFTMDVNDNDLCCMGTNKYEAHKSEVDPPQPPNPEIRHPLHKDCNQRE